jgi:hypothetical protein
MAVYWNDTLNAEFTEMRVVRKVPVAVMANHFGTSKAAIYAHARIIGALVMDRHVYTPEEVETLRAMVVAGNTDKEISVAMGRPIGSIRWKIDDLKLLAVRNAARIERAARKAVPVNAARRQTPATARQPRGKPGRPRGSRPLKPLDDEQIEMLKAKIDVLALHAIARGMQMSVATMKTRAKAAGVEIGISLRRHGHELTRETLELLIAEGLTPCQAGKRLNRDRRTVIQAADAFGLQFLTRKATVGQARLAKAVLPAAAGAAPARPRAAAREGDNRVKVDQSTHAPTGAKQVAKVSPVKAKAARSKAQRAPARRPVPPRQHQPVAVRVLEAPATANRVVPPAPPRRPFGFNFFSGTRPKEILSQAEVDAAVARFIRERGVTHVQATPEEAAVKAARRLGYAVLRAGAGFTLDGRIIVPTLAELQAFVRKREEARLQMSA